ncbi:putative inorganic phosphate cotransporter [Phymastichus coffea]|uniref:putative inorganic phosphate cotransporter n=1 Tax=Phymastichus coffea TaxID=108790 RepID=UPI00273C5AB2|nr:putative inorganic phosphate cotransporter [Phymastichus coffea]
MINSIDEHNEPLNKFGSRHVQVFLLFLGMAIAYTLRVCMSVALEAMTDNKSESSFPIYEWSTDKKSMILSSFFWGYVLTQIPAGQIANSQSAQKLLACGIGISAIINLFTPFLAQYGYIPVVASRIAMGLVQGCLLPCVQTLLSRWVPPLERARLGSLVMNGPQFGTVITMPISGAVAASSIGWPSVFYIFGAVAIAWSILFFLLGADRPSDHPRICPKEANYINSSLGNINKVEQLSKSKIPWKSLLTSLPMWSLIIVHSGHNWGFYLLLTKLPAYMKNALNYDISNSGMASAIPYLAMWILGFPISYVCDYALRHNVSLIVVRKISNTIGLWVPTVALIILSLITTNNSIILVAILAIAMGFNSGITCGFQINHIDLSPNFAGIMMSMTNGAANIFGIIAPLVCGVVVTNEADSSQWHIMFYITAGIYFATNLVFIIFGRGEIQSWNYSDNEPIPDQTRKVSVISITGEPISVTVPEKINEEEIKTLC